MNNIKMKNEKIFILCRKDHKNYKSQVKARTFEKDGIKFAIIGNSFDGFNLTLCENGMSIIYSPKMKDLLNNLDEIVYKLKNSDKIFLENAQKLFYDAEILEGE